MSSPRQELDDVMAELETLLKNPELGAELADKGVNASLALVALDGLRAYLAGDRARAAEELGTFSDEVLGRIALSSSEPPS
jgi:hypothetical protein